MARPPKTRKFSSLPNPVVYMPAGWSKSNAAPSEIAVEDFEIMRLVDGYAYSLQEAGAQMGVSKSTAGRTLERVRRIIALGIERRVSLCIDGGKELVLDPVPSSPPLPKNEGLLAIATDDNHDEALIDRIFGRTLYFTLVTAEGKIVKKLQNPGSASQRSAAKLAIACLKEEGVTRVVAGRFGSDALEALANANIEAVVATGLKLDQAIEIFNPK